MASVFDVAQYILDSHGPMTAMKLQKLVYYCQAWHIAWTDDVLFDSRIEAWVDGPVAPELFRKHRGAFRVSSVSGGASKNLTKPERTTVDKVVRFYGHRSPQWLIDLTHKEEPWRAARLGLAPGDSSNREITPEAMGRYYSSL
jgi:uncharacterized phage-associated protein